MSLPPSPQPRLSPPQLLKANRYKKQKVTHVSLSYRNLKLTGEIKLLLPIDIEHTPVLLDIVTLLGLLPGLIERLEHERVDAPCCHAADRFLPVGRSGLSAGDRVFEVFAASGPVGFADPEVDVLCSLDVLDFREAVRGQYKLGWGGEGRKGLRLHDVVKEGGSGVSDLLALPVRECIRKTISLAVANAHRVGKHT